MECSEHEISGDDLEHLDRIERALEDLGVDVHRVRTTAGYVYLYVGEIAYPSTDAEELEARAEGDAILRELLDSLGAQYAAPADVGDGLRVRPVRPDEV